MIKVVGYIHNIYVCECMPNTIENRRMIEYAIKHGMTAAIMRL